MNLEQVESMGAHDCAQYLAANVDKLPAKDRPFAESLVSSAATREPSDKQAYWLRELTKRAIGQPKRETVSLGNFSAISALFDKAAESLKFPKIVLSNDDRTLRLTRAGSQARVPGSINVTEKQNGESIWYGRILSNGAFEASPRQATPSDIVDTLKRFACDPAATATAHGRKTGSCCFCARELTDSNSVRAGYGPICAANYGLPWGAH
jgi:hypothetical protein